MTAGDQVTVILARRCYRGRVATVSLMRPAFSVLLANDSYDGLYWFGTHEEDRSWIRGWGDDVEAAFLLQRSARAT
jgi:hypothetical protein